MGDIGECAVSIVMEENILPPETAEEIVPSVVIVVSNTDTCLPTSPREPRFLSNIGKGTIAIVLIKACCRGLPNRPVGIEAGTIREIDVQPAIMIVVKESNAAAFCFDN